MGTKAAWWVRVSSGGQDEANQVPDITRYSEGHEYEHVRTYTLHDKSASKGEQQPYLDAMLADMAAGEFTVLVCWHSDRLDRRGILATFGTVTAAIEAGGRIESVQEPHFGKLGDVSSDLLTAIGASIAHEKSVHLKEQTKMAHDRIRETGALIGRPPWGYATEGAKYNRTLVPTEQGQRIIPEIFRRVCQRESLEAIAVWLEYESIAPMGIRKAGTRGKSGQWHARTLAAMIRNPAYMGLRCVQDPKTKRYDTGNILHECPELVPADLWKRANDALDSHPKGANRGRTAKPENRQMLATVLRCAACGSPMHPFRASGIYCCGGSGAHRKGCGTAVKITVADMAVNEIIGSTFNAPETERTLVTGQSFEAEIAAQQFRLRHVDQTLDDDAYLAQTSSIRAEISRLKSLPSEPDRWVDVPTGRTYARLWDALETCERGPWLKSQGFTVTASRQALVVRQGEVCATWTF